MGLPKRLTEMQKRFAEVTYDKHVAELGKIREEALKKGAFSAATNAEKNRGMAAGLYVERKIIKHGKLEDMTEEQLEAKMKKILEDYEPILKNITPEKPKLEKSKAKSQPSEDTSK